MAASRLKDIRFQIIMNFLVIPLFFGLFPLNTVPSALLFVARLDPLSYGVDALRYFLIGVATFPIALDIGVLVGITALFLAVGSYFFSRMEV